MAASSTAPSPQEHNGAIEDIVALRLLHNTGQQEWTFEAVNKPFALGNRAQIAYGGCTTALAVAAAYQSIAETALPTRRLYSVLGNFLGPTQLDAPIRVQVTSLRETRTFSTRFVVVKQQVNAETERTTLSATIDFVSTQGDRTAEGLTYSAQPRTSVSHHSKLKTATEQLDEEVASGNLHKGIRSAVREITKPMRALIEQKFTPEGIFFHNVNGVVPDRTHHQEHLPITDRVSYDWFKHHRPSVVTTDVLLPPTPQARAACMFTLVLDGAVAFVPLSFTNRFIFDVDSCSTLEFALRFHVDALHDDDAWNLRELTTIAGGDERTHSEARMWREDPTAADGLQLVATMTQSSVMRGQAPKDKKQEKAAKL